MRYINTKMYYLLLFIILCGILYLLNLFVCIQNVLFIKLNLNIPVHKRLLINGILVCRLIIISTEIVNKIDCILLHYIITLLMYCAQVTSKRFSKYYNWIESFNTIFVCDVFWNRIGAYQLAMYCIVIDMNLIWNIWATPLTILLL